MAQTEHAKRCATCTYWWTEWRESSEPGQCLFISDDNAASRAQIVIHPVPKDEVNVILQTSADFSCNHWEPKERD